MGTRALSGMVVGNILTTAAVRYPQRTSIICVSTGRRFTYRATDERCNRLANALLGLGLAKGDAVAFLCNNRAEIVECTGGSDEQRCALGADGPRGQPGVR